LNVTIEPDGDRFRAIVEDESKIVFNQTDYASSGSARHAVYQFVRANYDVPDAEHRESKPTKLSGPTAQIVSMLRRKAGENDRQVLQLRATADALEQEAKRLHSAADTLEGPSHA